MSDYSLNFTFDIQCRICFRLDRSTEQLFYIINQQTFSISFADNDLVSAITECTGHRYCGFLFRQGLSIG